jgi:hypothetical protein
MVAPAARVAEEGHVRVRVRAEALVGHPVPRPGLRPVVLHLLRQPGQLGLHLARGLQHQPPPLLREGLLARLHVVHHARVGAVEGGQARVVVGREVRRREQVVAAVLLEAPLEHLRHAVLHLGGVGQRAARPGQLVQALAHSHGRQGRLVRQRVAGHDPVGQPVQVASASS